MRDRREWAVKKSQQARWNARYHEAPGRFGAEPAALLVELVAGLEVGSAVEFGCGEGRNCRYLEDDGWAVLGIDFSTVAIKHARVCTQGSSFVCADVSKLSSDVVASGSFDLACAVFLHTCKRERERWFVEMVKAVRPGGYVIYVGHAPGAQPEPVRPAATALAHDKLQQLKVRYTGHDSAAEPGHNALTDFGILWRRI